MLGMYLAVWLSAQARLLGRGAARGRWRSACSAAWSKFLLLRRIYRAPELLQLLATFALVLVIRDFALWAWGPEDLLGPRAPGLAGAVEHRRRALPPVRPVPHRARAAGLCRPAFHSGEDPLGQSCCAPRRRTARWPRALGVNQRWLFTAVFALGALLAGLGGALAIPREPASLEIDLAVISDAFVVVVVGGLGSMPGAFLAALLIGADQGVLHRRWAIPKLTLAIEFVVMAVVLVLRPWGLLGRPAAEARGRGVRRAAAALSAGREAGLSPAPCSLLAAAPALCRSLCARSAHRHPGVRAVRRQPALHHGPGRHDFLRPCRLFRPGRLRRRPARVARRPADGARARGCAIRRGARRPRLRLVLRAALGRLHRRC